MKRFLQLFSGAVLLSVAGFGCGGGADTNTQKVDPGTVTKQPGTDKQGNPTPGAIKAPQVPPPPTK